MCRRHPAQVGVVQDKAVQVPQEGELLPGGVLGLVVLAQSRQPIRHLILQPLQKVPYVPIVDIEGAAVDVCNRCQFAHGNVLDAFFRHELHQRKPKLPFRLSHSAVYNFFFHSPIPPTCFLLS